MSGHLPPWQSQQQQASARGNATGSRSFHEQTASLRAPLNDSYGAVPPPSMYGQNAGAHQQALGSNHFSNPTFHHSQSRQLSQASSTQNSSSQGPHFNTTYQPSHQSGQHHTPAQGNMQPHQNVSAGLHPQQIQRPPLSVGPSRQSQFSQRAPQNRWSHTSSPLNNSAGPFTPQNMQTRAYSSAPSQNVVNSQGNSEGGASRSVSSAATDDSWEKVTWANVGVDAPPPPPPTAPPGATSASATSSESASPSVASIITGLSSNEPTSSQQGKAEASTAENADKEKNANEEEVELDMEKLAKKRTRFSDRYLRYLNSHSLDRELGPSGLPVTDAQKESKKRKRAQFDKNRDPITPDQSAEMNLSPEARARFLPIYRHTFLDGLTKELAYEKMVVQHRLLFKTKAQLANDGFLLDNLKCEILSDYVSNERTAMRFTASPTTADKDDNGKPLIAQDTESDAEGAAKPKAEIDLRFRDSGKRSAPTAPLSALSGDHEFTVGSTVFLSESHLSPVQDPYLIIATIASVTDRSVIITLDNAIDKELTHVGGEFRSVEKKQPKPMRGGFLRGRGGSRSRFPVQSRADRDAKRNLDRELDKYTAERTWRIDLAANHLPFSRQKEAVMKLTSSDAVCPEQLQYLICVDPRLDKKSDVEKAGEVQAAAAASDAAKASEGESKDDRSKKEASASASSAAASSGWKTAEQTEAGENVKPPVSDVPESEEEYSDMDISSSEEEGNKSTDSDAISGDEGRTEGVQILAPELVKPEPYKWTVPPDVPQEAKDAWRKCFKENDNDFFTSHADRVLLKAALDRLESIIIEEYTEQVKLAAKERSTEASGKEGQDSSKEAKSESAEKADSETKKKRKLEPSSKKESTSSSSSADSVAKKAKTADATENADGGPNTAVRAVLNSSQRNAIEEFASKRIMLIQGPPGTGKSHTTVQLAALWVRELGRAPILVAAQSNVAADNVLRGLLKIGIRAVRIGNEFKVARDLKHVHVRALLEKDKKDGAKLMELREDAETNRNAQAFRQARLLEKVITPRVIDAADVVVATCVGAGAGELDGAHFHTVLVDECSQATEPALLIPISKALHQVALIGDQKQLPPTVRSEDYAPGKEESGLQVSMFSRLLTHPVSPITLTMLKTQYRSHPLIMHWPSFRFYEKQIKSGVKSVDRPSPKGVPWKNNKPICFVSVETPEELDAFGSKKNAGQAKAVFALIERVMAAGELTCDDIGIVTPYAAQVALLKRMLSASRFAGLEINSVDGYQGREKELIIFASVRANPRGHIGFLKDERRINVAFTRPRRGLVVIGCRRTLTARDATWRSWFRWNDRFGSTVDAAEIVPHETTHGYYRRNTDRYYGWRDRKNYW